ncbi:hypothetical protein F7230_06655 [Corynebacterium sp. 320]|uniref:Uncharacterized protein n=1 Tax=Corynebacterium zhongnanshanii TaxID=2768834 RepID=A0ABQ6VCQ0_9CORY|nr:MULTISPECIES: DUF6474 family protein [Corynebacterium]KAB1503206.1 hypothetical protein F7230_06655 [Corynebacterium sp. 320]KAB1550581.1 hypothetical protein F7233_08530 [Corynebacterium sp. 321]KAB1550942.1 hypothetical protein F7232_07710 [Corynebacterium sp. 319]KAB3520002.1 hypothetical protein F8377_08875 [Corynebacterium zhongnanshanii]KAB3527003.1 hypothetical protein F8354_06655 [Corynebacterium sp. 250]
MGLLSTLRKRRQEKKAVYRAAKAKALAEAKANAKMEKRKEKYLRKTAKQVRKLDAKQLKERREHEENMARAALERAKAGRFNSKTVVRYAVAGRTLAPVLVPLGYRLLTQLQNGGLGGSVSSAAQSSDTVSRFSGSTASHQARIEQARSSIKQGVPSGFAKDVSERLDTLEDALKNARNMSDQQARAVLASVSRELDLVEAEIAQA